MDCLESRVWTCTLMHQVAQQITLEAINAGGLTLIVSYHLWLWYRIFKKRVEGEFQAYISVGGKQSMGGLG